MPKSFGRSRRKLLDPRERPALLRQEHKAVGLRVDDQAEASPDAFVKMFYHRASWF